MKKVISLVLLLTMVITMFAACAKKEAPAPTGTTAATEPSASAEATEPEAQAHYPVTIDTYNENKEKIQLTFDKAPEKVVVGYQNNIEAMLALGLGDRIVCCFGLDGDIREDLQEEFAKVNYQDNRPSKEDVIAMQPDLILGWSSLFAEDRLGGVGYWHESGTNTYMSLNSACRPKGTPQKVEDEMEDVLILGKIFNVEEKAQALVDDVYAEIARIQEHIAGKEKPQIAVLEEGKSGFRVYGANTLGGDVALHAGVELKIGAKDSAKIGAEDLIAANPDAIFMAWYDGSKGPEDVVKSITENPAFASLDAVKNNKVFAINLTNIYCSGLRCKNGVLTFAQNLYPELYSK